MRWCKPQLAYGIIVLIGNISVGLPVHALEPSVLDAVRDEAGSPDIAQQFVTLINFTALPGISGAAFAIDRDGDEPDYDIRKITVDGHCLQPISALPFDLQLEGGVGYSETDERAFNIKEVSGSTVATKTDRQIYSGRIGAGPSFDLYENFRLVPMFHVAISRFNNESGVGELVDDGTNKSVAELLTLDWSIWALTYAGSLNIFFDRQFDDRRLEFQLSYAHAETEVIDAPSSQLEVSGSNDIVTGLVRWTEPAGLRLFGQPLLWNVFATGTVLAGDGSTALGFNHFVELGAGLDLDLRDREYPFVEAIRLRASSIFGANVMGWQVGTGFRF